MAPEHVSARRDGLSVVVVSRNRPDMLRDCLETLACQELPPSDYEVVVVDDGSSPPLASALGEVTGLRPRLIRQDGLGLSAARNRGVAEAAHEVVAFVDDDAVACPGWARAVQAAFAAHGCMAVAGRILLDVDGQVPRWVTDHRLSYLSRFDLGDEDVVLREPPFGFGANFAVRRSAVVDVGGFRVDLGRSAGSMLSNEETDLLARVARLPGGVVYSAEAAVHHRVAADRLTKRWFRRRAHAQGASDVRAASASTAPALLLLRELARAGRAAPILARRGLDGRGLYDARLWLSYCAGRARQIVLDARGRGPA